MAAHVLRLRLDLLAGSFRSGGRRAGRAALALLAAAVVTVFLGRGIVQLRESAPDSSAIVTVVAGSAVGLACLLLPAAFAAADPMHPRRFAVFGLPTRRLVPALAAAWILAVPTWAIGAIGVCLYLLWSADGADAGRALLAAIVAVLVGVTLSQLGIAVSGVLLRERRPRPAVGVFTGAVLLVIVPALVLFTVGAGAGPLAAAPESAAEILSVTPLGAAVAFGATGDMIALAVALGTIAVAVGLWTVIVVRAARAGEGPSMRDDRIRLGWFAALPGTAGGAIAARSLIYGLRDSRYLANFLIVPVAALVTVAPLVLVGVPLELAALVPAPLMALLYGWLAHNDLAYDGTALWMHVAAAVRGTADRAGRLVPVFLVAVPLVAAAVVGGLAVSDRWALLPALAGICASLFLCGLGLSSISSAAAPYPAPRPGDGPFQQPQRTAGGLAQASVLLGALALTTPTAWLGWLSLSQSRSAAMPTLWAGVGTGLAVLCAGILIGGAVFRRRGSRLMEFAEAA